MTLHYYDYSKGQPVIPILRAERDQYPSKTVLIPEPGRKIQI